MASLSCATRRFLAIVATVAVIIAPASASPSPAPSRFVLSPKAACPPVICPTAVLLSKDWSPSQGTGSATVEWVDSSNTTLLELVFSAGGSQLPPTSRIYPYNVYVGVEWDVTKPRSVELTFRSKLAATFHSTATMLSSQGSSIITLLHTFSVAGDGGELTYEVTSASATLALHSTWHYTGVPAALTAVAAAAAQSPPSVFKGPAGASQQTDSMILSPAAVVAPAAATLAAAPSPAPSSAFNLNVNVSSWELDDPSFQDAAMAISLQGLANRAAPTLYLTYPANWTFSYTETVREFVATAHGVDFAPLDSPLHALAVLHAGAGVKGFVVYDPNVVRGPSPRFLLCCTFLVPASSPPRPLAPSPPLPHLLPSCIKFSNPRSFILSLARALSLGLCLYPWPPH